VHVYYGEELVRALAINPTVTYQPIGKGVGRPITVT
jgi:hypothetical protein